MDGRCRHAHEKKCGEKIGYFYLQHTFAIISPRSWCLATNKQAHPGVEHELDARENCRPEDIITFLVRELSKKKEEEKKNSKVGAVVYMKE